jgi:hypothetical protein
VVLFHSAIRGALEAFAAEAVALQAAEDVTPGQLAGLVERHRFLRSVCMFHSLSEEEVGQGGHGMVLLHRGRHGGGWSLLHMSNRYQHLEQVLGCDC